MTFGPRDDTMGPMREECVRVVYRVESVSMYVSVGHGPRGKRREGKDV